MTKSLSVLIAGLVLSALGSTAALAQNTVAVAVPAQAGSVDGTNENSDAFIWRLFTEQIAAPAFASMPKPVKFETWASDQDTFSNSPHWPDPNEPKQLHPSVLQMTKFPQITFLGEIGEARVQSRAGSALTSMAGPTGSPIDVQCLAPPGAGVGGFPGNGTPAPCVAEETKRNFAQFNYIVTNHLNNNAGRAAAFANSFKVEMPPEALAVKGDWIPVRMLLKWVPQLGDINNIERLYYTTNITNDFDVVEYALVSLHVSSRQNPNWVWGTFEHEMNPGRCDYIGCFDSFGAETPAILPNKTTFNTQYGACAKTEPLKALMRKANLSQVWENYCLKSTEVDFTAPDGTPYVLGNSVIEGIVGDGTVAASSCIACHSYASFGPTGAPTDSVRAILSFNPTGKTIPNVLVGSLPFAFMWGVLLGP